MLRLTLYVIIGIRIWRQCGYGCEERLWVWSGLQGLSLAYILLLIAFFMVAIPRFKVIFKPVKRFPPMLIDTIKARYRITILITPDQTFKIFWSYRYGTSRSRAFLRRRRWRKPKQYTRKKTDLKTLLPGNRLVWAAKKGPHFPNPNICIALANGHVLRQGTKFISAANRGRAPRRMI